MFDAFPHDKWDSTITTFWTYGVEGDTGTIILTILGVLLMIGCLIWFVRLEAGKLDRQAAMLRKAMGEPVAPGQPGP
jgi:LPXTG-motif cell wall-anchored protein